MEIQMAGQGGKIIYSDIRSITLTKNTVENKPQKNKSEEKISEKDVKKVVEKLNKLLESEKSHVCFFDNFYILRLDFYNSSFYSYIYVILLRKIYKTIT